MSITDKSSVLIIGAGVSIPFGLPLGGQMMNKICKNLTEEVTDLDKIQNINFGNRSEIPKTIKEINVYLKYPIHGAIYAKSMPQNILEYKSDKQKLVELADLLRNQTSETVDDFIVENPSYSELTKIAIATSFMTSLYEENLSNKYMHLRALDARQLDSCKITSERNWIHLLINIVRHGIREGRVTPKNKVKIITFNYDRILEYVLEKQFSNTERGKEYEHFLEYFEIIHVHGQCGKLLKNIHNPAKTCLEWAQGIHVVNETAVTKDIEVARKKAANIIQGSSEIYACGFSFSGPNCRMLKMGDPTKKVKERTIFYCNYDGNVGLNKIVEKYGVEREILPTGVIRIELGLDDVPTLIEEVCGTAEKPVGVVDWLRLGSLGELPG